MSVHKFDGDGCEVAASCLACPLSRCRYDAPGWYARNRARGVDCRMWETVVREGLTLQDAADRFEVTIRTIHRIRDRVNKQDLSDGDRAVFAALAGKQDV